jgi:uncharacterized protein (DUF427 family)
VWDYPRPPAVVECVDHVRVVHAGVTIADTRRALRVLETSQPPAYYLPPEDVAMELLVPSSSSTFCEWKGRASYWTLRLGGITVPDVAWSYETPTAPFEAIRGHLAFYAQRVDECWVTAPGAEPERVQPNPGSFYGGWITSRVVGPFKGGPGTQGW